MSEPKRYEYVSDGYTARFINPKTGHAAPYGEYVRWEDYARLKAEVERLVDERCLRGETNKQNETRIARLKAEVERLEKLKAELKVGVTSEGEKPDQSDKDFKITIGFNSMDEFERDVVSARQLIPQMIALSKEGNRS